MTALAKARLLAIAVPAALIAGALGSQYLGGLSPCEMCLWQRWPHYAAILLALAAIAAAGGRASRPLVILAALCILGSGAIGVFHAGVEYHWWRGLTRCATMPGSGGGDLLADVMARPLIQCDRAQWTFAGISLAGFNALFSLAGGTAILALCLRPIR